MTDTTTDTTPRTTPAIAAGTYDTTARRFVPESIAIVRIEESAAGGHLVTATLAASRPGASDGHATIEIPAGTTFADALAMMRGSSSQVLRQLAGHTAMADDELPDPLP